jgi:glycosidase
MKRLLLVLGCFVFAVGISYSQLLTWTPDFPKDNDNITITVDASKGNLGLFNYSPVSDVYVHTGVITNQSTGPANWRYVKFNQNFNQPNAQLLATSLGNNKWKFDITNIRAYYGVPAGETILRIAILFRNGAGTAVQRNADGSDMYVPIYDNNIHVRITQPLYQPLYIPLPEPINKQVGDNITITAISNQSANLSMWLNGPLIQSAPNSTTITANPVLTTAGPQEVIVDAQNGSGNSSDTLRFFVSPAPVILPLPAGVRDGINYETGNTSVVLVVYAPNKSRISVIGEFPGSNWVEQSNYVMNKTPDGNYWWLRITGLTPGTEYAYQYLVNGTLKLADAYSEKILDQANDGTIPASTYPNLKPFPAAFTSGIVSIVQTNAPVYTWAVNNFPRPDKRNLVVYELLLRDYLAAHDWKTLRDTLSYLKTLGVNAIEIMPFNEFEGNDSWGYNPDFYLAPDKYYGPKNSLKEFIDSCHKKGIAVLMDIALNHATGLCPLAALYWNPATNAPAADNPWFNTTARHPFNVFNDFNHESLATRYFTSRVVEHWLQEYKIDGFRFDLSKGFTQVNTCTTPGCNSNPEVSNWSVFDATRVAIWKRYYDTLQLKSPGSYVILEHFADNAEELELSNYGMLLWGNSNYNFNEASMGWVPTSNFEGILHTVRSWPNAHLIGYMESHDEERLVYKNLNFGNSAGTYDTRNLNTALRRVEMCAAFLLGAPGPKMIWEFGELGYDFSINRCADGSINNNCRLVPKPIRWDYKLVTERKRLYDIYSSLLKLRAHSWYKDVFIANNIALTRNLTGSFKWMTMRSAMDSSILCIIGNFDVTNQSGSFTFPVAGTWYDYLNGNTITATGSAQNISLLPGEYHVYVNRNLVNAVTTPVLDVNNPGNALQISVYPDPIQDNSVVKVYIPENGKVQVDLWDMIGKKIATVHSGILTKGTHHLPLDNSAKNLPSGTYFLKLQMNNKSIATKIIIP